MLGIARSGLCLSFVSLQGMDVEGHEGPCLIFVLSGVSMWPFIRLLLSPQTSHKHLLSPNPDLDSLQAMSSPSEVFPRPSPSRTIPICLLNLLVSSFPDMATIPGAWGQALSLSRADVTLFMALLHPATAAATVYMAQHYLETNVFLAFF